MSRPVIILSSLILAAAALFAGSFLFASKVSSQQFSRPTDNLAWLQSEFSLSVQEMRQVRELHEGYLPVCQGFCDQIALQKKDLNQLVHDAGNADSQQVATKLEEIAHLRAQCQAAMLKHFEEVSQVMPAEQGLRYLEEMRRLTLGSHEDIEKSMTDGQGNGHAHH